MIGVKRPLKLGGPKPPKSAKKKKGLKETQPIPEDATVIENPYAEYMVQKPSDLMEDSGFAEMAPPLTEVLEEGEIPSAQEMVQHILTEEKVLEFPDKLPHLMGFRYKLLLEKCRPSELIPGQPPSLTWLEERYAHLVEKEFWYNRLVKLACTYLETCEGDVFDKTQGDLEQAVGHLVPYTAAETEYLQLLENYKKSRLQIDGIPTLEFLRRHYATPQNAPEPVPTDSTSPEYLPDFSDEEAVTEAMEVDSTYVPNEYCPIHEDSKMTCLNADEVYGALLFKCTTPGCSVFYTSTTSEDVRYQLQEAIHPTVHEGLVHADLKCHCDYTPRMKLSQSQKNPGRVFLTCFKKNNPCNYFQWVHWKVRPPQGPMDAYVQKQPRAETYVQKPGRLYYTRHCPSDIQGVLAEQANQQLVKIGLDRFKKDNVERGSPNPWRKPDTVESAWGTPKPSGFVPSSGPFNSVGHQFRNGLYVGDKSFEREFFGPSSSEFSG